jgi:hypothetical protein
MTKTQKAAITDAPNGCGYRVTYIDREGCSTYATMSDYGQAKRFAAAVERDDNDAMNGRTRPFR